MDLYICKRSTYILYFVTWTIKSAASIRKAEDNILRSILVQMGKQFINAIHEGIRKARFVWLKQNQYCINLVDFREETQNILHILFVELESSRVSDSRSIKKAQMVTVIQFECIRFRLLSRSFSDIANSFVFVVHIAHLNAAFSNLTVLGCFRQRKRSWNQTDWFTDLNCILDCQILQIVSECINPSRFAHSSLTQNQNVQIFDKAAMNVIENSLKISSYTVIVIQIIPNNWLQIEIELYLPTSPT